MLANKLFNHMPAPFFVCVEVGFHKIWKKMRSEKQKNNKKNGNGENERGYSY